MYNKAFYIDEIVGNNALSYDERINKKLYVPSCIESHDFDDINFTDEITFESHDFDDILQSCSGLKNFYEFSWNGKKIFLFDNHNHAYFFWYLERERRVISDNALLYHVDEHADTRDPGEYLMKPESLDMQKVFHYTNYVYNVGNYIIPAEKEGIIGTTVQIRNEYNLLEYESGNFKKLETDNRSIILNLDLDFFEPELDFIDVELKKRVILDIAEKADTITVATSPFFIDQKRAIDYFKNIFGSCT